MVHEGTSPAKPDGVSDQPPGLGTEDRGGEHGNDVEGILAGEHGGTGDHGPADRRYAGPPHRDQGENGEVGPQATGSGGLGGGKRVHHVARPSWLWIGHEAATANLT